jgi:cell division protein ZapA (FtsZ GTPase activity inhibitor)
MAVEKLQFINALATKRKEIESHIGSLEQDLEQARRDLSAILAATALFSGEGPKPTAYMNLSRLFPRHELPRLAKASLKNASAPISTRDIAAHIIEVKGLDGRDRHLRKAIAYKVIQHMRRLARERRVIRLGKVGGAVVWCNHIF